MLKVGVTSGCAGMMIVAAALAVRPRDTRRTSSPLSGSEAFGERLAVTMGRAGGMPCRPPASCARYQPLRSAGSRPSLALGGEATLTPTRVVLTGDGGSTFDLAAER